MLEKADEVSEGSQPVNHLSPSTAKVCEMVPFKPSNSGRQEPSLPASWGCPTPGSDLSKVGPWLRHHLPAFQALSKMPARGVELIVLVYFLFPGQGIHLCSSGRGIFFVDKRGQWLLPEGNPREQTCSSSWCSCQHPLAALEPKSFSSGLRSCLLLWRCSCQHRKLIPEAEKAEFSESQSYLHSLRLWQEV